MSSHDEVAHAWANKTGRHRKGHNMFYEGDTIYSYGYHFPIARHMTTPDGRNVVLFTTDSYSVSTAKHLTITARACRHLRVFHVPHMRDGIDGLDHVRNVTAYIRRITDALEKAKRARKYGPGHLRTAEIITEEARAYIETFQVGGYENFNWDHDALVEGVREATRIQLEASERARQQIEERQRRYYRETVWPEIKRWLQGEITDRPSTKRPLPRISHDRVETTWGANVPLEVAKLLYWRSIRCRREHTEYVPERSFHVGDFRLTRIKPNGDLVVGCHDIPFWFMHYAAKRAGIPDKPASIAA